MKKLIAITLLACAGCDTQLGRLDVTPPLATACQWWIGTGPTADVAIDTLIGVAEADRQQGFTFSEEMVGLQYGCTFGGLVDIDCMACGTAVVRQVYGQ
ncbi:MAG: hypothetical protein GY906_38985 [bacterium]|nr:hypothetical protein [bacterium]